MTNQQQQQQPTSSAYEYPSGHLGHLSTTQEGALQAFKKLCSERNVYDPDPQSQAQRYPSHSDALLLRFLRARRFELEPAYQQFTDTEKWREANTIEKLYSEIDVDEYEQTRRLYPQWTGRRDKRGLAVYVYEVAKLNPEDVASYEKVTALKNTNLTNDTEAQTPVKMLRLFALYEHFLNFVCPWCTSMSDRPYSPDTPITQGNNIIDLTGTGLKQIWALKNHLQDASQLATAHYPESLDKIFIVGAPSFFSTIWNWVKRWLDPIVVSKINIVPSTSLLSTLSQFIDPENIPEKYGGQLKWSFGDMPNLDPKMQAVIESWGPAAVSSNSTAGTKSIPIGPIKWEEENGMMVAYTEGKRDGKSRRELLVKLNTPFRQVFYSTDSSSGSGSESQRGKVSFENEKQMDGSVGSVETVTPSIPTSAGPPVKAVNH